MKPYDFTEGLRCNFY